MRSRTSAATVGVPMPPIHGPHARPPMPARWPHRCGRDEGLCCATQTAGRNVRSDHAPGGSGPLSTSDPGPQSATHAQLTMPSWHPGEDLTRLEEEMKDKAAAG